MTGSYRSSQAHRIVGRMFAAVLAAAFVLSGAPTAQAAPALAWQTSTLVADPDGSIVVCKGQKRAFGVNVKVTTYRIFGGTGGSWIYPPNQWVDASGTNSNAGTISPGSRLTGMIPGYVRPRAEFEFTANDLGTAEVTFSDRGTAATWTTPDRPLADPVTVTIEVKECKYLIRAVSDWTIAKGFRPHATANFEVEVTPDKNGAFDVRVQVYNQAEWTVGFACSHTLTADETNAGVKGSVAFGLIGFHVTYDPVTGSTFIPCPAPYVGQVSGENQDSGVPRVITPARLDVALSPVANSTVMTLVPHDLEADGTWPGQTQVSVTTIPQ